MQFATGMEQQARGVAQWSRKHRAQPAIEIDRAPHVSGNDVHLIQDGGVVGHRSAEA